MTVPSYSIDAGTQIHGVTAAWNNAPVQPQDDGRLTFSPWRLHIWQIDTLPVARWLELRAARGAALTSLETNDYDYPNEAQTYDDAILETLSGQHIGHLMRNVVVEFRVEDSSRTLGAFSNGFSHGFKT